MEGPRVVENLICQIPHGGLSDDFIPLVSSISVGGRQALAVGPKDV